MVFGIGAFASAFFLFPFWLHKHNMDSGNHYTASKALTPGQIQRGAFLNSGTHDIGPDPAWHQRHGIVPIEGVEVDRIKAAAAAKKQQSA